ncbi:DDE family transposase [Streptomyces sp. T12]|nr:DDE family transposase [Streptomyces sp. T12]
MLRHHEAQLAGPLRILAQFRYPVRPGLAGLAGTWTAAVGLGAPEEIADVQWLAAGLAWIVTVVLYAAAGPRLHAVAGDLRLLEDRVLLVAAYWRTNLTPRQLAPLFGVSKSAADRIIDHLGPLRAFHPRQRFREGTVLIVDGTLVPTRDHTVAEQSKNYRHSTNHQVVIDADTRLVVAVGRPVTGNRNDCKAWELSGAKDAVGRTTVIAVPAAHGRPAHPPRAAPLAMAHGHAGVRDRPRGLISSNALRTASTAAVTIFGSARMTGWSSSSEAKAWATIHTVLWEAAEDMRYQAARCVGRFAAMLVRFTLDGALTAPSTAELG